MKNCLILITDSYPYSIGETFLESEAEFLSKQFDKVITLAIATDENAPVTRKTPENFDCYNVAKTSKKISRAISFLEGIVKTAFPAPGLESEAKKSIRHRLFHGYFCARSEREFALCEDVLDKYDFSQYDSVTVYSYWLFVTAMVGTMICDKISDKCKKIRFVSRGHRYDIYDYANSLKYLPEREYLLSRLDKLYICSIDGKEYMRGLFPQYKEKIEHSYLGTLDCSVTPMNDEGYHIVSCSRMKNVKRVDRIASSLALLAKENLGRLEWTHIGDGETMNTVKEICEEKLSFMKVNLIGNISNEDVRGFYKENKIDLFINVSTSEGLPVSIMEAMSFSVPVLATDVGGVDEIVKDGFNGFLIDDNFSDEELAEKIKETMLLAKDERESMRRNSRAFWEDNFDAKKNYTVFAAEISG